MDRPNTQHRDTINAVLVHLHNIGRRQAAAALYRQGVPLAVIARVLHEPERRRQR